MVNDMENYFFTFCRKCGKQILMVRNVSTGRWTPCDPLVIRFVPDKEGPEYFINEFGETEHGIYDGSIGRVGYKKHTARCKWRLGA